MNVQHRPMQARDIEKCVEHIGAHPILRSRYGRVIKQLPSAIRRVLGQDSLVALVFEDFQRSPARYLGAGLAAFVCDDFLREVKTTRSFWIGPELVKRITTGESPLLSHAQMRVANSCGGLNLIVWHNTCHPEDTKHVELPMAVMNAFVASYRGFRLKEVLAQADRPTALGGGRDAGGFYFDRATGCYGDFPEVPERNFSMEPHNFGMTREMASAHGSSWLGSLFVYTLPRFGFTRGEQRLLLSALAVGGTDEELGKELGVTASAVKMTWRSIYHRVAVRLPDLIADSRRLENDVPRRGKEKKQRLLDYLRKHPEELRPVSMRLLKGRP